MNFISILKITNWKVIQLIGKHLEGSDATALYLKITDMILQNVDKPIVSLWNELFGKIISIQTMLMNFCQLNFFFHRKDDIWIWFSKPTPTGGQYWVGHSYKQTSFSWIILHFNNMTHCVNCKPMKIRIFIVNNDSSKKRICTLLCQSFSNICWIEFKRLKNGA